MAAGPNVFPLGEGSTMPKAGKQSTRNLCWRASGACKTGDSLTWERKWQLSMKMTICAGFVRM